MRRLVRLIPVALVAVGVSWMQARSPARAQAPAGGVDPALFHGLEFRSAGPPRGGRSTTVTGVPSEPRTFYMGVASGGLFKTTDAGESWFPVTDGQVPLGSTGSVAVADSDPNVVYLGTGSDDVRSNVSTGRGVYKSTDAGKTWSFAGLRDAGQIGGVRISPTDPNTAWVAAQGDAFTNNAARGVFKTTDGGTNWRKTLFVSDAIGAMDVELQPGNPQVVYAWMSHLQRKPWTIISGGPASDGAGFYKSTDGGEHFTKMTTGLPSDLIGKGNIAVTAASPNRVYALIEAKPGGGLYRSEDAGQTWAAVNLNPEIITRPFYYDTLGADPTNADTIYLGDENWWKSTDGGRTLQPMRTPHGDNHDIWVNPKDGTVMIQSNDGGANVSTDGGETWSTQLNQPTAELYGVWMDDQFPYNLYAAQQDDSTEIMPMNADPLDSSSWRNAPGCETGPVMPKPNDSNIVYGACKGQFSVMDMRTGQERNYWVGAQSLYGNPASDLIDRFQRVSPMATSPLDPSVVYFGSQYLHKSTDLGVTWQTISPDLTAHPVGTQGASGEPITRDVTGEEFYSTLYAITQAATEPGVIWTGSNDGPFYVTRDDGKTWTDVTPKDLPPGGRVQYIDASPFRKGSAYFAVYRYLLGDYQPYLYKTDDYGKTWTRLTDGKNGIPADTPTRVVREDPNREGLLYAGTEFGLYISFDDGKHWQPLQLNLPQVPVTDIKVYHKDLVLTTQGRSFWILDDLSAVEQLDPAMAGPAVGTTAPHLFAPRDGYRTQVSPNLLGPTFQYYLPEGTSGPVTLDVLDSTGAVVDSYISSGAAAGGAGRGRAGRGGGGRGAGAGRGRGAGAGGGGGFFGRGRGGAVTRATADAGVNKVVWDLRDRDGVELPPGKYQVRLTAGGASQTEPFTVLIDPRIAADGITVADLVEQYQHNTRMHALVTDINALLSRVEAARQGATGGKAKALQDLYDQIIPTPEGVRYAKPGLQEQITYLAGMTSRVDQKVGRDALDRYQTLKKQFDDLKAQADRVIG